MKDFEVLIGLEIHAELNTKSKIFCSCKNEYGAPANTLVCPTCLGLAGATPSLNRRAVELAVMAGEAMGCDINNYSVFERRNFFYPDLPKSYQITQRSHPICSGGGIKLDNGKFVAFSRMHLEEDMGKIVKGDKCDYIDFNRSGIPLVEFVTEPELSNADEVVEFVSKLKEKLIFAGVSDCRMEEGGLRFDVNMSVREKKMYDALGTRVELKNLNSFKNLAKCIDYESRRQMSDLERGVAVKRETRVWDDNLNRTYARRAKEDTKDYRYFPDPDLMPLQLTDEDILRIKSEMPESKESKINKYLSLGLSRETIDILTQDKFMSDFYDSLVMWVHNPHECANWVTNDIQHKYRTQKNMNIEHIISVENLAYIIELVLSNQISRNNAKLLFEEVVSTGKSASSCVKEMGLICKVEDEDIKEILKSEIDKTPAIKDDFNINPEEVINYLLGRIMYATNGMAMPDRAREVVLEFLK